MAFPNVSDIITTTLEKRSKKVQDNVTKNIALLSQLQKKGRISTVSGGRLIYEAVSFAANGNGGWYSGYDALPVAAQDVITSAEFNWKQYAVPVVISGREVAQNSGEEGLMDLLEERINVAESTMKNDVEVGLYSDGTGSSGNIITGMDAAVPQDPTTGTYGNINRATYTFWRSQLQTGVQTSSIIQATMNALWASCTRGSDQPDLIMAGATSWAFFLGSLQTIQRVTDPNSATAGFGSLKYITADVVLSGGIGGAATAADMYFINTNYLKFRPHKDRNMVPLSPEKRYAVNQDASVSILGWMGNLTSSGPQFCGRLKGS